MRVLMVGDVVGRGGRHAFATLLPELRAELQIDKVCVQGENAAAGFGLTGKTAAELLDAGADVITVGNHIWDKREIIPHLDDEKIPLVRALNYPTGTPGRGVLQTDDFAVIHLLGSGIVYGLDAPFSTVERLLDNGFGADTPVVVDFHAEITSEKVAMGCFLDGRVSAVVGTHIHVPTADTKILPEGTAYVTDLGIVGAVDSVLGMKKDAAVNRLATGIRERLEPVERGCFQFNSVLIEIDEKTKKARSITRVDRFCEI